MNYFHINAALEVTAISGDFPADARGNPDAWWRKTDDTHGTGWANRNDFDSMMLAQQVADSATRLTGRLYIAIDRGPYTSPRFDVIEAPMVGDEVSEAFNGDSYYLGKIVKISDSLRVVTVEGGRKFCRRGESGSWQSRGFCMVRGIVEKRNPHI